MGISGARRVLGIGVNDSPAPTSWWEGQKRKTCKFYQVWCSMLERCYCPRFQEKKPTYIGCSVDTHWHRFSNFKSWMEQQDWEGKYLDKDLKVIGNKVYSPDTCIFVSKAVNNFLTASDKVRGQYPIGVHRDARSGKFIAQCSGKYLGVFGTPDEAHLAWTIRKREDAERLALQEGGDVYVYLDARFGPFKEINKDARRIQLIDHFKGETK